MVDGSDRLSGVPETVFILGAGFNRDAKDEAGPIVGQSMFIGRHEIKCGYPLVEDLWAICYPDRTPNPSRSFEEELADSLERGDLDPLEMLFHELLKADYYIASQLASDGTHRASSYMDFFDRFQDAAYLTFNYDSLVEIQLLRLGRWNPLDGFGTPVAASIDVLGPAPENVPSSKNFVLHLHGSLCVVTSTTTSEVDYQTRTEWIKPKAVRDFRFDPSLNGGLFYPYLGSQTKSGDDLSLEARVVAPIPSKTTGLAREFIRAMYKRAGELICSAQSVVAIGYGFNIFDEESYRPLLQDISNLNKPLCIVAPNSDDIIRRLRGEYSRLELTPEPVGFKEWVRRGFPCKDGP